jgi:hypothetical protein
MGVLDALIGHGGAKTIMRSALRAGDVHILLEGPPASGKSVALMEIDDSVPGTMYADAAGFTEREMRDTFAEDPTILLLDEIDAAKNDAYEALSMPMEQGRVTKNTNHEQYDREVNTQVFAACNAAEDLPRHTADRFRTITFEEYDYDEYLDVCAVLLPEEANWVETAQDARDVAEAVYDAIGSKSPRDARDAAKLAGRKGRVAKIARALEDPKADVESEPLTPGEVKRAQDHRGTGGPGGDGGAAVSFEDWKDRACPHLASNADEGTSLDFHDGRLNCHRCQEEYDVGPKEPLDG